MDVSTIAGLAIGLVILVLALILGHVPIETLLSPEAIIVVFGGTLTATLVSFDASTLRSAWRAMQDAFTDNRMSTAQHVNYVMDVARFVRAEGILALQTLLPGIELPYLRKGLSLVVDNRPEQFVRESLSTEAEVIYREELDHARVFETAGGFAPTMGIIGAVIGLIYVVQSFDDPKTLGQGVASAFSATLYGVAIANLFLLPIAGKLKQRAREHWFHHALMLEAITSIHREEHPLVLEEKIEAFLIREKQDIPKATQHRDDYQAIGI